MSDLKIKKEVQGTALIDLGMRGSLTFDAVTVYQNEWSEKDMVLLIVDKNDPNNKIQLTFSKPAEYIEVKPPVPEQPAEKPADETTA